MLRDTVRLIGEGIRSGSEYPPLRIHAANVATRAPGHKDYRGQLRAIYDDFRDRWRYVRDIDQLETVATTGPAIWGLVAGAYNDNPDERGAGDCDDATAYLGAAARAVGFPVRIVTQSRPGETAQTHVYPEMMINQDEWIPLDPVAHPLPFGNAPPAGSRIIWDLYGRTVKGAQFGRGKRPPKLAGDNLAGILWQGQEEADQRYPLIYEPDLDELKEVPTPGHFFRKKTGSEWKNKFEDSWEMAVAAYGEENKEHGHWLINNAEWNNSFQYGKEKDILDESGPPNWINRVYGMDETGRRYTYLYPEDRPTHPERPIRRAEPNEGYFPAIWIPPFQDRLVEPLEWLEAKGREMRAPGEVDPDVARRTKQLKEKLERSAQDAAKKRHDKWRAIGVDDMNQKTFQRFFMELSDEDRDDLFLVPHYVRKFHTGWRWWMEQKGEWGEKEQAIWDAMAEYMKTARAPRPPALLPHPKPFSLVKIPPWMGKPLAPILTPTRAPAATSTKKKPKPSPGPTIPGPTRPGPTRPGQKLPAKLPAVFISPKLWQPSARLKLPGATIETLTRQAQDKRREAAGEEASSLLAQLTKALQTMEL